MAVRTTLTDVKNVIETSLIDGDITSLINQANLIVTRKVGGEGLTSELLKDIETWLTAHLIAITKERQPEKEKVGQIEALYHKNPDGIMEQTTYGQMVLFLDTSGKFQESEKKRTSFNAIKQINT